MLTLGFCKEGYRDGVDAGKEASLQHGFNVGYREGAAKMVAIGQLKGIVSAMQCWCQQQQLNSPLLRQLFQDVVKHEEAMVKNMEMAKLHPQANVRDVMDHIEDLMVRGTDSASEGEDCAMTDCCSEEGAEEGDLSSLSVCRNPTCDTFSLEQRLEQLMKTCLDLVAELGLPEGLSNHIKQLMST
ncbi:OTU deubiquitinase with linear linkage specificity a isoform X2 [Brienomyrus brachyistius]|uniref:OTU deubiquitinase with linear linkage specificity a isoform X2 n=1 Tax=Brienomyrus brachyistius TaxID=42636 RepID=UPI0020B2AE7A|nr:OTU deubiquitinase with linear linkage specificity a isoform X2 [Brienomyrus brachyistius]XP_048862280.1 OTU deubiquitinase with linear linkage specificity a isoform X2 [Brienomyrus brachyistius]